MPTIAQITLKTVDALPENYLSNQFCIDVDTPGETDSDTIADAFIAFYSSLTTTVFSSWLSQTGHVCKLYQAGGPKPNYPFYEKTINLTSAPSGTGLPTEVAMCLSFQGTRTAGLPQARRRGRIYIGPLKATVNSNQRPLLAAREDIRDAALQLYTDLAAVPGSAGWCVWSALDGLAVPLDNCWVDDSFDTQRSRGQAPTTRTTGLF